jgi:hypothetical protein
LPPTRENDNAEVIAFGESSAPVEVLQYSFARNETSCRNKGHRQATLAVEFDRLCNLYAQYRRSVRDQYCSVAPCVKAQYPGLLILTGFAAIL